MYEEMQLDYETNLLACCDGGKREQKSDSIRKEDIYCETPKGDAILPINPLIPGCDNMFMFSEDGEVIGVNKAAEVTIKILNLNSPVIKTMRKYAIDNYVLCPVDDWEAEIERLQARNGNGQFEEFCFVLESYIKLFHT